MKTILLPVLFLCALRAYSQGTFVYDQQSADETTGGGVTVTIQPNQPLGQSFSPTLSSVGFIRLNVGDTAANGLGATLYVNLRSGSITGPILASSDPVALPDGFFGYPDFLFHTPVDVTPNVPYFFQPVVQSGDLWVAIAYPYGYLGGTAFRQGTPIPSDLWFREGIVVPEPSSRTFLLAGIGLLLAWRVLINFRPTRC